MTQGVVEITISRKNYRSTRLSDLQKVAVIRSFEISPSRVVPFVPEVFKNGGGSLREILVKQELHAAS